MRARPPFPTNPNSCLINGEPFTCVCLEGKGTAKIIPLEALPAEQEILAHVHVTDHPGETPSYSASWNLRRRLFAVFAFIRASVSGDAPSIPPVLPPSERHTSVHRE